MRTDNRLYLCLSRISCFLLLFHGMNRRTKVKAMKLRDDYTYGGCGWTDNEAVRMRVHHINPLEDSEYDEKSYPDDLLVTLQCVPFEV